MIQQFRKNNFYIYPEVIERENHWQVPKILHFIWIGSKTKPIPEKYVNNIESFSISSNYKVK